MKGPCKDSCRIGVAVFIVDSPWQPTIAESESRGQVMIKLAITGAVTAVIAAAFAISAAGASGVGPSKPSAAGASAMSEPGGASAGVSAASAYEPHLTPADFSPVVDNPYF